MKRTCWKTLAAALWAASASTASAQPVREPIADGTGTAALVGPGRVQVLTGAQTARSSWLYSYGALSGKASPGVAAILSPNAFYIGGDNVDTGNTELNGVQIVHSADAGLTGTRQAISALVVQNGTPAAPFFDNAYVGGQLSVRMTANNGGLSRAFAQTHGGAFGFNPQVIANPGATYLREVAGGEVNVAVEAGGSVAELYGLAITQTSDHSVRGTYDDAALVVANQDRTGTTWKNGIQIGSYSAASAFAPDSTILAVVPRTLPRRVTPAFANGIDLRAGAFSKFAFVSPGASIDGSGAIVATALKAGTVSAAGGIGAFGATPLASKCIFTGSRRSAAAAIMGQLMTCLERAGIAVNRTTP